MRGIVCGSGLLCERSCPVMAIGRECPPLLEFLREVEALSLQRGASPAR